MTRTKPPPRAQHPLPSPAHTRSPKNNTLQKALRFLNNISLASFYKWNRKNDRQKVLYSLPSYVKMNHVRVLKCEVCHIIKFTIQYDYLIMFFVSLMFDFYLVHFLATRSHFKD